MKSAKFLKERGNISLVSINFCPRKRAHARERETNQMYPEYKREREKEREETGERQEKTKTHGVNGRDSAHVR
jgi:hypothetical protein